MFNATIASLFTVDIKMSRNGDCYSCPGKLFFKSADPPPPLNLAALMGSLVGMVAVLHLLGARQGLLGAACPVAMPLLSRGWIHRVRLLLNHLLHPLVACIAGFGPR